MIVPVESLSPSLRRNGRRATAFELKFLVNETQARLVEEWIAQRLRIDPHCDAALGNAYRVSSLYLDTPELAVFHKEGAFARRKFRLRRYGDEQVIFLERKTKWGNRLIKRRSWVPAADVARLAGAAFDPAWTGHWFHRHLHLRRLRPVCQVQYARVAYIGDSEHGPVRLTVDRQLVCAPHGDWMNPPAPPPQPLLMDEAIVELKFATSLPTLFRHLVYELALGPNTISKYRRAVQIWGQDALPREYRQCRMT
jgi:hypothetical protein